MANVVHVNTFWVGSAFSVLPLWILLSSWPCWWIAMVTHPEPQVPWLRVHAKVFQGDFQAVHVSLLWPPHVLVCPLPTRHKIPCLTSDVSPSSINQVSAPSWSWWMEVDSQTLTWCSTGQTVSEAFVSSRFCSGSCRAAKIMHTVPPPLSLKPHWVSGRSLWLSRWMMSWFNRIWARNFPPVEGNDMPLWLSQHFLSLFLL